MSSPRKVRWRKPASLVRRTSGGVSVTVLAGEGPSFIHAHVVRPYSHSLSDDERLYRPDAERQDEASRDPVTRLQMFLIREGILDDSLGAEVARLRRNGVD